MCPTRLARFLMAACLLAGACSDPGSGRYHVSGKVTLDGMPVPVGKIYFHADVPRGNAGPPAFAEIHNGTYDTRQGGSGGPGGAVLASIEGFDGKSNAMDNRGQPLFPPYYLEVVLPRAHAVKDFNVLTSSARSLPKSPDPAP